MESVELWCSERAEFRLQHSHLTQSFDTASSLFSYPCHDVARLSLLQSEKLSAALMRSSLCYVLIDLATFDVWPSGFSLAFLPIALQLDLRVTNGYHRPSVDGKEGDYNASKPENETLTQF